MAQKICKVRRQVRRRCRTLQTWKGGWIELHLNYRFPFYRVQVFLKREMENKLIYEEKHLFGDVAKLKFEKKRLLFVVIRAIAIYASKGGYLVGTGGKKL